MNTLDRRTFLLRSAVAGAGLLGAGSILDACSSASKATGASNSSSGSTSLTSINYRLDWIKNFEFTGSYFADARGYYKAEGLNVSLVPSGLTDTIEPQVVSGKDLVATSYSETVAPAILAGADLRIIGSIYQKSPYAIVSRSAQPLHTPQDMIGKTIAVSPSNKTTFTAFCQTNNVDVSKIKIVPETGADPAPLAAGAIDGWLGYVMDEPSTLRSRGVKVDTLLLADYDFNLYEAVYIVTGDALIHKRDLIKAFMRAEIKGWQDSIADPGAGAQLTVSKYGKDLGLDASAQKLASAAQNDIVVTNDPTRGILTLDPKLLDATISSLVSVGINISKEKLYDTSLLNEVYGGKATL